MIYAVIVACEIGFWIAIGLGLTARYVMRKPRLGAGLLLLAPVLDVVLLVSTALHLRSGAEPTAAHSLAALYLGFSIAYGHAMVRWADVRVAHRFAGGPPPVRVYGRERAAASRRDVGRTLLAAVIAVVVMGGLAGIADVPFAPFVSTVQLLGLILAIEVVVAVCDSVWPRKAPAGAVAVGTSDRSAARAATVD